MPTHSLTRSPAARSPLETYLRDINETPLLTAKEEKELANRIVEGDAEARDHLVRANLRLVVTIARAYGSRGLELADLIEEGNMGLMRAAEGFDPTQNTRFSTYAAYWIKQSIKRAIVNTSLTIRVPAYMHDLLSRWRKAARQLQNDLDRQPTDEEIGAELGLTGKQLRVIKKAVKMYNSAPQTGHEDEMPHDDVFLDDKSFGPENPVIQTETVEHVLKLIERMDDREATVLRLRYGLNGNRPNTLKEIGDQLGLTRERVRQIERYALTKLAEELQAN